MTCVVKLTMPHCLKSSSSRRQVDTFGNRSSPPGATEVGLSTRCVAKGAAALCYTRAGYYGARSCVVAAKEAWDGKRSDTTSGLDHHLWLVRRFRRIYGPLRLPLERDRAYTPEPHCWTTRQMPCLQYTEHYARTPAATRQPSQDYGVLL